MDCIRPIQVRITKGIRAGEIVTVPCGHCMSCRIKRTKEWTVRLTMEESKWSDSVFLTLQYDEDHVPITPCGKRYLYKKDLQDFFKRLRARIDVPIRYYACGEYGDQFGRPHFHVILFGKGFSKDDEKDYNAAWQYRGHIFLEPVCAQNIGYVCGYCKKKIYYDRFDEFKEYGCLPSPFQVSSQGLGLDYFKDNVEYFRKNPHFKYRGNNCNVPRYFVGKDSILKTKIDYDAVLRSRENDYDESNPYHNPDCLENHWQHELELRAKFAARDKKL